MQYKIKATPQQLRDLKTHIFDDYPTEIKDKELTIEASEQTYTFFSMVKAFLKQPILVDFMTQELVKFEVL